MSNISKMSKMSTDVSEQKEKEIPNWGRAGFIYLCLAFTYISMPCSSSHLDDVVYTIHSCISWPFAVLACFGSFFFVHLSSCVTWSLLSMSNELQSPSRWWNFCWGRGRVTICTIVCCYACAGICLHGLLDASSQFGLMVFFCLHCFFWLYSSPALLGPESSPQKS